MQVLPMSTLAPPPLVPQRPVPQPLVPPRARMRAVVPLDVVSFVSACPACGVDCEWTQLREETRVRTSLACPCTGAP